MVFFTGLPLSITVLRFLGSKIWSHVTAISLASSQPEKIGSRYRQRFAYERQFQLQCRAGIVYSFKSASVQAGDLFATFSYSILYFVPLLL